jgi:hypothetical protein
MTSLISIGGTRKEVGGCMPTSPSQFKLGHIVITMMFFSPRSDRYWWDSSAIHHWDPNNGINAHMGHNNAISMHATFGTNDTSKKPPLFQP